MSRSDKPQKASSSSQVGEDVSVSHETIRYPKPKILVLDLPPLASAKLRSKGFNVNEGTLGKPYKVARNSGYEALICKSNVPNHTEQEIVIVDLGYGKLDSGPQAGKHRPEGEPDLWGKCDQGFLDPRVRISRELRPSLDRIHSSGGVFVVFADAKIPIELQIAYIGRYEHLEGEEMFPFDVWDFLDELADMRVDTDQGAEMQRGEADTPLARLLAPFLENGIFTCSLEGGYRSEDKWQTLAMNKYGAAVALARCCGNDGTVIVLPQIRDKSDFLLKLFTTVLPEIAPHLFPHIERGLWTHLPEYELPKVIDLKSQQEEAERRAREEIALLEKELEMERETQGWIHNLLTGTDDELVVAVKRALSEIGFSGVVDVDEERDKEGKSRREDLQITDQSPTLIIDIKGIGGYPSDDDALQADKHATLRMREENRTDINGLSIINHQRHLPPLDRENAMPFRQELIDVAEEHILGLMTAWDLYRLVRNFRKLTWKSEDVKPVFYKKGRIEIVPAHYHFIGTIAKAWTDKFGVVIEDGELKVGDSIAIEFPIEFEETKIDSIMVDNIGVEIAKVGDQTGLLWSVDAPKLREGMRVFRVHSTS
jgi:CBS domain-containing protein